MEKSSLNEAGNVLFIILLVVGLFAALSYTITQSDRGGGNIDKAQAQVVANEVIAYASSISAAVEQIRQEGFGENDIKFSHPLLSNTYGTYDAAPAAEVFNPRGGGVTFQLAGGIASAGDPIFSATNDVRNVGTRCANAGCTNCTSINSQNCTDLVMYIPINNPLICQGVNKTYRHRRKC